MGEALAAAQKAASKDVSAAAISLLESPPADLWLRLTTVSWQGLLCCCAPGSRLNGCMMR